MKLTLGFSPCPNDTFIFEALVNGEIDTPGIEFETVLEDVETLNRWALEGKLDITKLSFPAYFQSKNNYSLLNAGAALGKGVGPLLISNNNKEFTEKDINEADIILPGINTTAHLLFSFAYPKATKKSFAVFHEIEAALVSGRADLGVIIHENRFTYQQKGLFKVCDLGTVWEEKTKVPVPLGGIAIKNNLGKELFDTVNEWIQRSLTIAYSRQTKITDYIKKHAQSMSEEVMHQHIKLYVNQYSLNLGPDGRQAIEQLENVYRKISSANYSLTKEQ